MIFFIKSTMGFLDNLMIGFVPDMLEQFFNGSMSREEFSYLYIHRLNKVKLYLSQMPKDLRKENQQVFRNEFELADKLNRLAINCKNYSDEAFKDAIYDHMQGYINSVKERCADIDNTTC